MIRKFTRDYTNINWSPKRMWEWLWRKYRIKYAEERERDLSDREYCYPDYPIELNRGKFEWQPRHPNPVLHIRPDERFTISDEACNRIFPTGSGDEFGWTDRKWQVGGYICTGHVLEVEGYNG